jgi:hypothetical protein
MDAVQKKDVPINKKVQICLKNIFLYTKYVRKTISLPFFVANFYENCPFLELYPKLSLSDRDILHSSHTAGAI